MAKKAKWYTAIVNFTTKEIIYAHEWTTKDEAAHQDELNEVGAAMLAAGLGDDETGKRRDKGDDWQAWGPETEPFSFDKIVESA